MPCKMDLTEGLMLCQDSMPPYDIPKEITEVTIQLVTSICNTTAVQMIPSTIPWVTVRKCCPDNRGIICESVGGRACPLLNCGGLTSLHDFTDSTNPIDSAYQGCDWKSSELLEWIFVLGTPVLVMLCALIIFTMWLRRSLKIGQLRGSCTSYCLPSKTARITPQRPFVTFITPPSRETLCIKYPLRSPHQPPPPRHTPFHAGCEKVDIMALGLQRL